MAWYNPQKISIDPNSGVIGASGAMGRALYDIYQDNAKNNFTAAKLDEDARHNQASEQLMGAKMQQDLDLSNRDFEFKKERAKTQDEQWGKNYALDQDKLSATRENNAALRNIGWYNAQTARQTAETNAELKALKANIAGRQLAGELDANKALAGKLGIEIPEQYAADPYALNEYLKAQVKARTNKNLSGAMGLGINYKNAPAGQQKLLENAFKQIAAADAFARDYNSIGGIEKNSGIIDRAGLKFPNITTGDADKSHGAIGDAAINNFASVIRDTSSGNGNFNYKTAKEDLTPGWLGAGQAITNAYAKRDQAIRNAQTIIDNLEAQGYGGLDEYKLNLAKAREINKENYIRVLNGENPLNGGQFGLSGWQGYAQAEQTDRAARYKQYKAARQTAPALPSNIQKMQQTLNGEGNQTAPVNSNLNKRQGGFDYPNADELGVLYQEW